MTTADPPCQGPDTIDTCPCRFHTRLDWECLPDDDEPPTLAEYRRERFPEHYR
jgi:hypothetical protein